MDPHSKTLTRFVFIMTNKSNYLSDRLRKWIILLPRELLNDLTYGDFSLLIINNKMFRVLDYSTYGN